MIRHVLLLLLGAHLVSAGKHSLRYFFSAVSEINDFPEFTIVGQVDEGQFMYFDSKMMKVVPKTEWIRQSEGADYWDRQTQIGIGEHQRFKVDIQTLKGRFNHTTGVHTYQLMYGCEWDDQSGAKDAFRQYGYNGEDYVIMDWKQQRYVAAVQQGIPAVQRWNEKTNLEGRKHYLSTICTEWLQKYVQYGKSSLEKTVSPQVSLLQKDPSSPVTCHATGFYPSGVTITWQKIKQDHDEDVDLGELIPNEDGTFQKTSTLRVTPEEWKKNQFTCVVEHQGETIRKILTEGEIKTNYENSVSIGIIVGAVVAVGLLIATGVIGYMVYQKKKGFKPVNASDDGSNSSAHTDPRA